ncbi:PLPP1_2_3 [Lepeophtheirus salmonis]|uniref:PLPP1_2_3 n=1 Tax=Lepeophtheirus salmonis TaxID=72036 RepID=A0A7R8H8C8_LEPSM|nr:PLPP1_2_3 [Lepeophtheirus salmonis]CAF2937625.1 PLPP1_2_3 [Lepeophtheirus salmonis]
MTRVVYEENVVFFQCPYNQIKRKRKVMGLSLTHHLISPGKNGFFCEDASIKYPFRDELFPTWLLLLIAIPVPCLVITLVDFITSGRRAWKMTALNSAHVSIVYLFGCGPCANPMSLALRGVNEFHQDYVCLGDDEDAIKKSIRSFPSGHASVGAYIATFLSLYFQTKIRSGTGTLARPILQLTVFAFAWGAGLCRVTDYRHHLSDVFAGFALGILVGFIIVRGGKINLFPLLTNGRTSQSVPTIESSCPSNRESRVSTFFY